MGSFNVTLTGTAPVIFHNARLVDPLDPIVEQIATITSQMKKSSSDHMMVSQLEFTGGIYFLDEIGPYLPSGHLFQAVVEAARLTRGGKKIERGVFLKDYMLPLDYDGPRTLAELWEDKRFVLRVPATVGRARVMRTRPWFQQWSTSTTVVFDPSQIAFAELSSYIIKAGSMIGVGDWRPMHGRFSVEFSEVDQDA